MEEVAGSKAEEEAEEEGRYPSKDVVGDVLRIVSTTLPLRDVCTLLQLSSWCRQQLESHSSLWKSLDFRERNNAGERLVAALSLGRYKDIQELNLEFAQGIIDNHLISLKPLSLQNLQILNLNCCQKITDTGVKAVALACPKLKFFSIYWNVRISDSSIKYLVENCKEIVSLNLSGCKNLTDKSLQLISKHYKGLKHLNLTRCIKLTDEGLIQLIDSCQSIEDLNLYADSSFADKSYVKMCNLTKLRVLDLCGAMNLSDEGLSAIAKCRNLVSLNLTWCVSVSDVGVTAVSQNCHFLELLSLFGIQGVTDSCLEHLAQFCSQTLTTLDINGCINIKKHSRADLLQLFPKLVCFKVHS